MHQQLQQHRTPGLTCSMLLQVLHVHGFSGVGLHCAYLVVACYLMYSCEYDTFTKAVESLPNPAMQLVASSTGARTPMQRYGPSARQALHGCFIPQLPAVQPTHGPLQHCIQTYLI